jgi:N-hydroxyarylamine O-acetyltransferase
MIKNQIILEYLSILNLDFQLPTYEFLEKICTAHLNTFPFENISKLIYYKDKISHIDVNMFVNQFNEYQFGGTCYTLNSNLFMLLKALGFDCYLIMLGGQHLGIIVRLDGVKYYVDCGAAAPFFKPVDFERDQKNNTRFGLDCINLLPADTQGDEYKYVRYMNGKQSGETWTFHSEKDYRFEDFAEVISKSNKEDAPFMTFLRCQLYQSNRKRSVSLVNNSLTIRYDNGESTVSKYKSKHEIKEIMKSEFNLPKLPVMEAIKILEELDINIFSEY